MPLKIASLPAGLALRIIFAFSFGFFLSMFTRALSNLLKAPVQQELALTESQISLALGASFFLTFALAQLPVGMLLDRYDPRRVNALLLVLAAAGSVMMGLAESAAMLTVGRILVGLGFAAGLMASLKAYTLWFPPERMPTLNGLQFAIGVLGAWSATLPVDFLLRVMTWREVYLLFAAVTALAAVLVWWLAPRRNEDVTDESFGEQLAGLGRVLGHRYFWTVGPWLCVSMGISQGLNTLYIFPWLTDVAGYDRSAAAAAVSGVMLVSAVNYAVMGPLVEWLSRRGYSRLVVPGVGQLLSMTMLLLLVIQVPQAVVLQWVLWNVFSGTSTLAYAALSETFPARLIGRVYTAFNLLGFLATALAQSVVGLILDGYAVEASGAVAPQGYRIAFAVLLATQLLAGLWFLVLNRGAASDDTA